MKAMTRAGLAILAVTASVAAFVVVRALPLQDSA
jgi:hypothetical protein